MRQVIAIALGAILGICGAAATSPTLAQAPNQPASTQTACTVLSPKEIEQLSKRANQFNLNPEVDVVSKTMTECHYLDFDLQLTQGMTREAFDATRSSQVKMGHKIESVAGVGDDAYFWERPNGEYGLVAIALRAGQSRFSIQYMGGPDSVKVMKPVLLALAKAAAPKLR